MADRDTWNTPAEQSDEGTAPWAEWEHSQRRSPLRPPGSRGGFGRPDEDEDYPRLERVERRRRARRRGRRSGYSPSHAEHGDFGGDGYYVPDRDIEGQGDFGERAGYDHGYAPRRNRSRNNVPRQPYSPGREDPNVRGYSDRFGEYQRGFQGAHEQGAGRGQYGYEGRTEEDAYYGGIDESVGYGHGPSFEGVRQQSDYGLDAGYTAGGSSGGIRRGEYYGHGPVNYTRSDERILDDVCERLTIDGDVDARNIHVSVEDGEVVLTGNVSSRSIKHRAENIADSVTGVKDISNQLKVASTAEGGQPPEG